MILVRFRQTFRERLPEWIMATVTLCWGFSAWLDAISDVPHHAFEGAFYGPLNLLMPQRSWGLYAFIIGSVRLVCLYINGSRPRGSAIARAFGAWLSTFFWVGLFVGAWLLPWASLARFTYGGLLAFDIFGLWFAAGDARLAVLRARGDLKYGLD